MLQNINFCGKCNKFCQIAMYVHTRYCYLPLLWESWNWPECGVGIVPICFGAAADVRTLKLSGVPQFTLVKMIFKTVE